MTERRDDLLRRVVKAAAEGGLARRSLRDLAAGVGTSHRMLIHHFGSREGLLAAGMTEEELVRVREVMSDPGFRASSSVLHSVQGRKRS